MKTVQITINVPVNEAGLVEIPVNKTGENFAMDPARVNDESQTRIWFYGARQITNDCHANVKLDAEKMSDDELLSAHQAVTAAIAKRWDAIYSGEWRVRGTGESADPVEREAMALAREAVRLAYAAGRKVNKQWPKWGDVDESKRDASAAKELDKKRAHYMDAARANIEARKAAASGVDLSALGL